MKNDGVKVSWDDEIPDIYIYMYIYIYGKIIQMFQTTNQRYHDHMDLAHMFYLVGGCC